MQVDQLGVLDVVVSLNNLPDFSNDRCVHFAV
jgi:hypothetical protein